MDCESNTLLRFAVNFFTNETVQKIHFNLHQVIIHNEQSFRLEVVNIRQEKLCSCPKNLRSIQGFKYASHS